MRDRKPCGSLAAETGHLVLSTVHTTDMASTIARIADSFPDERQNTIRQSSMRRGNHDADAGAESGAGSCPRRSC
jgi:Tfp pilus assembly pilus retraction ATPase PilT